MKIYSVIDIKLGSSVFVFSAPSDEIAHRQFFMLCTSPTHISFPADFHLWRIGSLYERGCRIEDTDNEFICSLDTLVPTSDD